MTVLASVREAWRRMGLGQRVAMLALVAVCGGAAALLVNWVRRPHLALLYAGLEPQEAARLMEVVRESGAAYELRDGGTSVYADAEKVYALRLELAGQGLPAGGHEGYRLLDQEKIGTSPFTQRVNLRRAIEGELAKTIGLLEGVAAARVHIVQPETRLFQNDSKGTSATVVLRLVPGWRLTPGNIAAVVHLVAGSVEHCKPADVVVVDSAGNLLSGDGGDGFAKSAGTLLDYKTQVEHYLAKKAEDMLTMVLGPGRATVRVDAKIETSSVNQTVEKFDPGGKVPAKEETKTKSASGGAKPPEGAAAPPAGTTKEETVLTDYLVSRTLEQTVNMPGKILSLSVAAFVDLSPPEAPPSATAAPPGAAPAGTPTPPAPPLGVKDVEEIIRSAIGLQETDALKVVSVPFRRPPAPDAPPEEEGLLASPGFYLDLARHASVGILAIGALLVLKMFGSARRKALDAAGAAGALPGGTINLLAGGAEPRVADPGELRGRITAALQENPQEVKRLFRTWAEGGKEGA